ALRDLPGDVRQYDRDGGLLPQGIGLTPPGDAPMGADANAAAQRSAPGQAVGHRLRRQRGAGPRRPVTLAAGLPEVDRLDRQVMGMTNDGMPNDERMPNDECPMTKEGRMSQARRSPAGLPKRRCSFVIRSSSFFRHWAFVIRHYVRPRRVRFSRTR